MSVSRNGRGNGNGRFDESFVDDIDVYYEICKSVEVLYLNRENLSDKISSKLLTKLYQ